MIKKRMSEKLTCKNNFRCAHSIAIFANAVRKNNSKKWGLQKEK